MKLNNSEHDYFFFFFFMFVCWLSLLFFWGGEDLFSFILLKFIACFTILSIQRFLFQIFCFYFSCWRIVWDCPFIQNVYIHWNMSVLLFTQHYFVWFFFSSFGFCIGFAFQLLVSFCISGKKKKLNIVLCWFLSFVSHKLCHDCDDEKFDLSKSTEKSKKINSKLNYCWLLRSLFSHFIQRVEHFDKLENSVCTVFFISFFFHFHSNYC